MIRILIALLLAPLAHAQMAAGQDEAIQLWKTAKEFTLAVAAAMPAEHYGFKPDPGEMTFGALMNHIATSQAFRLAQMAGEPVSLKFPKGEPKQVSRELLEQSFDYCIAKLAAFTPAQWNKVYKVDWYQRPEVNGRLLVMAMFTHTAHHRGQAEVYMRAKGIKPPDYRF